jgi:hypothetical protein
VVAGHAADVADHLQQWFEAGACDGFPIAVDGYHDGFDAFVDQVVPILQERGLFHDDYEGPTTADERRDLRSMSRSRPTRLAVRWWPDGPGLTSGAG